MQSDIAVVGTGLSGLLTALSLARQEFSVVLIGPEPRTADDKRTTAILHPGIEFLQSLGAWRNETRFATPLNTMEIVDETKAHRFTATSVGFNEFGFNISNDALKQELAKKIRGNKNITWKKSLLKAAKKSKSGWILSLDKDAACEVTLLIGADGRNSSVRELAQIAYQEKETGQGALVGTITAEQPHGFTSVEWYRAGGPLTLVPMPGKELALVWCDDQEILRGKQKSSSETLSRELTQLTQKRFGHLHVKDKLQFWPVRPIKANTIMASQLALVGEAAHVLPPIGAQGFNTSIQDIMTLTACLAKGQRLGLPLSDATILTQYERQRSRDVQVRYFGSNALNTIIRAQHPAGRLFRRLSLGAIDLFPIIKTGLMRATLGLQKDIA